MNTLPSQFEELADLVWALANDWLDAGGASRLQRLLESDAANRRVYIELMDQFAVLEWEKGDGRRQGTAGSPNLEEDSGFRVQDSGFEVWESENANPKFQIPNQQISSLESPAPPIILDLSAPLPSPLTTSYYPLTTNFVGGPVFSYMVATVIVGMMLLGAWAYKITHYQQIVDNRPQSINRPDMQFVGQVTGMVDCRWSDPKTATIIGASTPLNRKYALASGLMEITYDSGATVILQGPCTYEVESPAGGFLALGKLTARVVSGQWPVASAKPQAANLQIFKSPNLQIPNHSPLSPLPSPLFAVRTPTALITDLGTEFGVEVSAEGNTMSHVFRGSVKVQVVGGDDRREGVILRENESARVEKRDGKPSITRRAVGEKSEFVLEMPPPRSIRDSEAYAQLVLSLKPVVYYRMERPGGTAGLSSSGSEGRTLLDKPAVPPVAVAPARVVNDSAGDGHHGELRLGDEFGGLPYVPGRFGDALLLRGPAVCDRVIVPDYPKAADNQLTVSAWVLATGRPGWATIVSNWRGDSARDVGEEGQFYFGMYRFDGNPCVSMLERDGRKWAHVMDKAYQPFPLFVWQHVAFVADGAALHLYRNGKPVASSPCAGIKPQPALSGLGIGCKLNNGPGSDASTDTPGYNFWQGRIDEVAIFNHALPPSAIRRLAWMQNDNQAGLGEGTGVFFAPERPKNEPVPSQ